jgi:hypothetical protein
VLCFMVVPLLLLIFAAHLIMFIRKAFT